MGLGKVCLILGLIMRKSNQIERIIHIFEIFSKKPRHKFLKTRMQSFPPKIQQKLKIIHVLLQHSMMIDISYDWSLYTTMVVSQQHFMVLLLESII